MIGPESDDLRALAERVPNGATVALFKEQTPVALVRALVEREVRDLHLVTVPTGGLAADLLIGAGCVRTIETSGVTFGEHGAAPAFARAVRSGTVRPLDSTCPAVYAALQAGGKGIPFIPIRGVLGTDVLRHRSDWRVIDNPFEERGSSSPKGGSLSKSDPVVVLPALRPDVALLHVARADRYGNVWIGAEEGLRIVTQAANRVLVTTEELVDGDLMADPLSAAGTLPAFYVDRVALAPRGSWPLALDGCYPEDVEAIRRYLERARSGAPVSAWLEPLAAAA